MKVVLCTKEESNNYLAHYRVGGEKKGIRRWQNKDGSYTPEGYKHYAEMYGWGKDQKKVQDDPHMFSSGDSKNRMEAVWGDGGEAPEYSKKILSHVNIPVEKLSDLKHLDENVDISEIRYNINHPDKESYVKIGKDILSDTGRRYNCPACACAFELTERGYDVVARRAADGSNVGDIEKYFKGGKLRQIKASKWTDSLIRLEDEPEDAAKSLNWEKKVRKYYESLNVAREKAITELKDTLEKQGPGSRGIIVVGWLQDYSVAKTTEFHALNYRIESNGALELYDTQSRRRYNGTSDLSMLYGCDPRELHYMRTDDLEIDDSITEKVYSRGKGIK